jgi:hypothetical protein
LEARLGYIYSTNKPGGELRVTRISLHECQWLGTLVVILERREAVFSVVRDTGETTRLRKKNRTVAFQAHAALNANTANFYVSLDGASPTCGAMWLVASETQGKQLKNRTITFQAHAALNANTANFYVSLDGASLTCGAMRLVASETQGETTRIKKKCIF